MDIGAPLGVRKGAWTEEEDLLLRKCIEKYGEGKWHQIPLRAGLNRCRKSCRLRWLNYLKPDIKRGNFTADEVDLIIRLRKLLGNRWSLIAGRLPGRTANDVKNYWNTHLQKKLISQSQDDPVKSTVPKKHVGVKVFRPQPRTVSSKNLPWLRNETTTTNNNNNNNIQRNQDNLNRPCPTLVQENKEKSWWDDMVLDMEINTAGAAWSSGGLSTEESIIGLWDEKVSTEPLEMLMAGDESSIQEFQSDWSDIFIDNVDLWDLLKGEETVV